MTKQAEKITIYTTALCGYCLRAKHLLENKRVGFEEIDVTFDPAQRKAMTERANGATTLPQIFICGQHVGGCDEIYSLEIEGKLDPLLRECLEQPIFTEDQNMETPNAG